MKITEKELYSSSEFIGEIENLEEVLNFSPRKDWIKEHEQIKGHQYLPIKEFEWLLKRLFGFPTIHIKSVIKDQNSVTVTVYATLKNGNSIYDVSGIGSAEINARQNVSMASPLAKTLAVKDAVELVGTIFGKDLNRSRGVITVLKPEISFEDESIFDVHWFALSQCESLEAVNSYKVNNSVGMDKKNQDKLNALCKKRIIDING